MTGQELVDWLLRLPAEALSKRVVHLVTDADGFACDEEVDTVDYNSSVVTLR